MIIYDDKAQIKVLKFTYQRGMLLFQRDDAQNLQNKNDLVVFRSSWAL